MKWAGIMLLSTLAVVAAPDIRSFQPDLTVPALFAGKPAAGVRVKQTHPHWAKTSAYHTLYLPKDWRPGKSYPVLIEYAGNGPYQNRFGDVSTGKPEGSKMGFGISGGRGFIWVCIPYLNNAGNKNVTQWWGDKPKYNPQPTLEYCKKVVPWICKNYGGDIKNVVLCGFSRGAIACNYLGLYDDDIARLWRAFIPYSHYDGGLIRFQIRNRLRDVCKGWPAGLCSYAMKARASVGRKNFWIAPK